MKSFKVLFTRKIRNAQQRIINPDFNLTEIEFIKIEGVDRTEAAAKIAVIPDDGTLVFTSANAVRYFAEAVNHVSANWKICSLAGATQIAIFEFLKADRVYLAAPNATLLADQMITFGVDRKVFFICGDKRRNELPEKLKHAGLSVEEIAVYKTLLSPQQVDDDFDAIAFFSPSAVESFFMKNQIDRDKILFSIGATTTATIRKQVQNRVITSNMNTEEDVIESIERYMKEKSGKI